VEIILDEAASSEDEYSIGSADDIDEWDVGSEAKVGEVCLDGLVFNKNHSG